MKIKRQNYITHSTIIKINLFFQFGQIWITGRNAIKCRNLNVKKPYAELSNLACRILDIPAT